MKKTNLLTILLFISIFSFSQKFAYVDTDYILKKIPEYTQAEEQINKYSNQWQQEIENGYKNIEEMYKAYQSEQILLTKEMKIKREEAIIEAEKSIQNLQQKYFGADGDLVKKRTELVTPIQNRILDAIQQLAANNKYSIIFDTSSDLIMLYTNPDLDKSDRVLEIMGY